MLEKIITSKPYPPFTLIQDENTSKALNLFKGILKRDIENDDIKEIHIICTKNPPEFYLSSFDAQKVFTYNLFKDPCCWIQSNSIDCDGLFEEMLVSQKLESTVMIDSINQIILQKDINYVCNIIHKLKEKFMRVVCLVQGDIINDTDFLKKLFFFSSISVKVHLNFSNSLICNSDKHWLAVEGVQKKANGKVVMVKEFYKVDDEYVIHSKALNEKWEDDDKSVPESSMRGLTTFRVGVDIQENEKAAKDNLILPYLRTANTTCECKEEETEGKVVYYAESGDDLEEDPDDDLDI